MDIGYRKVTDFPRGTLCVLLKEEYSFEPRFERDCLNQWQEFEKFFYDNPHIAEFSGFMTVLSDVPIGFVLWVRRKQSCRCWRKCRICRLS